MHHAGAARGASRAAGDRRGEDRQVGERAARLDVGERGHDRPHHRQRREERERGEQQHAWSRRRSRAGGPRGSPRRRRRRSTATSSILDDRSCASSSLPPAAPKATPARARAEYYFSGARTRGERDTRGRDLGQERHVAPAPACARAARPAPLDQANSREQRSARPAGAAAGRCWRWRGRTGRCCRAATARAADVDGGAARPLPPAIAARSPVVLCARRPRRPDRWPPPARAAGRRRPCPSRP